MLTHDTETPDIETASDGYAARFAGSVGEFLLSIQDRTVRQALERLARHDLNILELGSGHAQLTQTLLDYSADLWAQGSRADCSKRLESFLSSNPKKLRFISSSLFNLPFPDRNFDCVVAVRLLAHIERRSDFFKEMCRVSKTAVIFDYPKYSAFNFLSPLLFGIKRRAEGNTRPYFTFRRAQIESWLRESGFDQTVEFRQFVMPMAFHRILKFPGFSRVLEGLFRATGVTRFFGSPAVMIAIRRHEGSIS